MTVKDCLIQNCYEMAFSKHKDNSNKNLFNAVMLQLHVELLTTKLPTSLGSSRQGPEGVDIIFHEPKGMGWHFVIINRQAGLLMYFKMLWVSHAKTM